MAAPIPSMTGGAGGSAGPSDAQSATYGSNSDNSGWNVNFSGVQSASSNQDKSGGSGLGLNSIGSSVPWWVWAALAAGVVVWRLKASKK